ncbi:MAG: lamin tail domain-containing protein [Stigonema ocellatum SAG 48.90 = DSM 106950]|nr:lamin tail domain-containing protein [Stigonema ocellatum SAG 48.90 = DSM 106950]
MKKLFSKYKIAQVGDERKMSIVRSCALALKRNYELKRFTKLAVAIILCLTTVLSLPNSAQAINTQTNQAVAISNILYDGAVKRTESDEYVEITNQRSANVDISGWRLNSGDTGQNFYFPKGTVLPPKKSFRVYTDEVHPETGGFSFGINRAIWNNKGGVGRLYDPKGQLVATFSYPKPAVVTSQPQKPGVKGAK